MSAKGWIILILAIWLIVSVLIPGISGSKGANLANFLIVGIIFLITGAVSLKDVKIAAWIVLLSGIWLIISAFIPGITGSKGAAITNGIIFGILNLIFSFYLKKKKE
ncbi:SPW repeat protein [Thermotoga sp.]|uniref:SPW repeat domain-containing protein n=1 Tax=Thermotoga sp. TaxID=28240 RepID=UPI0025F7D41C|nr:SPW repeat protein [Thermotoga sp.]MCD6551707.1 SPW repeat protein [Thermotoga sp.]